MKKIGSFSLITAVALSAQILPSNVINQNSLALENGGTKHAIDAYSDGSGSFVIESATQKTFDNSPMNQLVFKYGEEAKKNNAKLYEQVLTVDQNANDIEKHNAIKVRDNENSITQNPEGNLIPENGVACDDHNANTFDDIYTNGVCSGYSAVFSRTAANGSVLNITSMNGSIETFSMDVYTGTLPRGVTLPNGYINTKIVLKSGETQVSLARIENSSEKDFSQYLKSKTTLKLVNITSSVEIVNIESYTKFSITDNGDYDLNPDVGIIEIRQF